MNTPRCADLAPLCLRLALAIRPAQGARRRRSVRDGVHVRFDGVR